MSSARNVNQDSEDDELKLSQSNILTYREEEVVPAFTQEEIAKNEEQL